MGVYTQKQGLDILNKGLAEIQLRRYTDKGDTKGALAHINKIKNSDDPAQKALLPNLTKFLKNSLAEQNALNEEIEDRQERIDLEYTKTYARQITDIDNLGNGINIVDEKENC